MAIGMLRKYLRWFKNKLCLKKEVFSDVPCSRGIFAVCGMGTSIAHRLRADTVNCFSTPLAGFGGILTVRVTRLSTNLTA